MIVAFSTSSPYTSVALISPTGDILAARREYAPMQASGACFRQLEALLDETGTTLSQATLFAADRGPGSFTGVKVAVTIAKTLAYAAKVRVVGADSFDLIDARKTVVMPSKRGEFFIRRVGEEPVRSASLPDEAYAGFGPGVEVESYPDAAHFAGLLESVAPIDPEYLLPNYLIEPSISKPKAPLSFVQESRG